MRAAMEGERQLQHVLEIVGQHGLAAAMGEPVRVQRDQHAAADGEQAEADPGGEQRRQDREIRRLRGALRAHQRVDDAAEQHRLGELRDRERHIGAGEHPAEPRLGAEQAKHARIELEEIHRAAGWVARCTLAEGRDAAIGASAAYPARIFLPTVWRKSRAFHGRLASAMVLEQSLIADGSDFT